ncbi:MAG: O-antigen ligase family protein [Terracidiphilus sp.]
MSTIVVFALLLSMWVIKVVSRKREASTGLQAIALAFIVFSGISGIMSLVRGYRALDVLNDLVPALEIYIAFRLGASISFSSKRVQRCIAIALQMILARGIWHLILIFTGQKLASLEETLPWATVSGLTYVRPIDPLMGLAASLAFVLYLSGFHRKLSLAVFAVTSVVCLLGMTRAEWIATVFCICMGVLFMRGNKARKVVIAGLAASIAIYMLTLYVPDLAEATETRLIQHTIEQVSNSDNDEGRLRFLEYRTALDKFTDAPLIGNGVGSNFRTAVFNGYKVKFAVIHNFYLNLLADGGALGIVLFCAVVIPAVKLSVTTARSATSRLEQALAMCAMTALVWWGILISMHPIYSAYHLTVVIGALYGVMLAVRRAASAQAARSDRLLFANGSVFLLRNMQATTMCQRVNIARSSNGNTNTIVAN